MKKEEKIYLIIIGILILISLLTFAYFLSIQPQFAPLEFIPPIPQNCSDIEIKALWDYTFNSVSSDNIEIFKPIGFTTNPCSNFSAINLNPRIILGTEGIILQLTTILNNSADFTSDQIILLNIENGTTYDATILEEGNAIIEINGYNYSINYFGNHTIPTEDLYIKIENIEESPLKNNINLQKGFKDSFIKMGDPVWTGKIYEVLQIINSSSLDPINDDKILIKDRNNINYTATIILEGEAIILLDDILHNINYYGDSSSPLEDMYITISSQSVPLNILNNKQKVFLKGNIIATIEDSKNRQFQILQGTTTISPGLESFLSIINTTYFAYEGIATSVGRDLLNNTNYSSIIKIKNILLDSEQNIPTNLSIRNFYDLFTSNQSFKLSFTESPGDWQNIDLTLFSEYKYNKTNYDSEIYEIIGTINRNFSLNKLYYNEVTTECIANYSSYRTSCFEDDTIQIWYNDSNNCENPINPLPTNETEDCDYDNNKIIGKKESITANNLNISIYINDETLNDSKIYNDSRQIHFRDGNIVIVDFLFNFSENTLNLKNIKIEKQSNSDNFGYLIIEGLTLNKTIKVDRINGSSTICIKDRIEVDITQFTASCSGSTELELDCPGQSTSKYTCTIENNKFVITGLTNSGVKEMELGTSSDNSNDNSNRDSININNTQNSTRNQTSRTPSCIPDWTNGCTEWKPEICTKDEKQTRTCVDKNKCNTNSGKPPVSQNCEYKETFPFTTIIIIILSLIIGLIIIIIIVLVLKRKPKTQGLPSTPYTYNPTSPPPSRPQFTKSPPRQPPSALSITKPQQPRQPFQPQRY